MTIEPTKIELEESPCDLNFIRALLSKIDYNAILSARSQIVDRCLADLGSDFVLPELPASINVSSDTKDNKDKAELSLDDEVLKKVHTILLDVHVVEGHLICPDTGRRFKIMNGIPNMILHVDEI